MTLVPYTYPGVSNTIEGASDVDASTQANGKVLTVDSSNGFPLSWQTPQASGPSVAAVSFNTVANADGSFTSTAPLNSLPVAGPIRYKVVGYIMRNSPSNDGASFSIGTSQTAQSTAGETIMIQWRAVGGGNVLVTYGEAGTVKQTLGLTGSANTFPNFLGWVPFELYVTISSSTLVSAMLILGGVLIGSLNATNYNNGAFGFNPEESTTSSLETNLYMCYNTPGFSGQGDSTPNTSIEGVYVYSD